MLMSLSSTRSASSCPWLTVYVSRPASPSEVNFTFGPSADCVHEIQTLSALFAISRMIFVSSALTIDRTVL